MAVRPNHSGMVQALHFEGDGASAGNIASLQGNASARSTALPWPSIEGQGHVRLGSANQSPTSGYGRCAPSMFARPRTTARLNAHRSSDMLDRYVSSASALFHTIVVVGAAMTASACGATVVVSDDQARTSANGSGASGASGGSGRGGGSAVSGQGGAAGFGGNGACTPMPCEETATITECGDCLDNDSDAMTDVNDPDCTNACSPNEDCPMMQCPGDAQPCGLACLRPCSRDYYCIAGCCTVAIA